MYRRVVPSSATQELLVVPEPRLPGACSEGDLRTQQRSDSRDLCENREWALKTAISVRPFSARIPSHSRRLFVGGVILLLVTKAPKSEEYRRRSIATLVCVSVVRPERRDVPERKMGQPELDDSKNVYPGINLHELDGTGRVRSEAVPQVGEHVMEGARSDEETAEHIPDVMPEGGYGWVIVGCMIAMNASTWGECPVPSCNRDGTAVGCFISG